MWWKQRHKTYPFSSSVTLIAGALLEHLRQHLHARVHAMVLVVAHVIKPDTPRVASRHSRSTAGRAHAEGITILELHTVADETIDIRCVRLAPVRDPKIAGNRVHKRTKGNAAMRQRLVRILHENIREHKTEFLLTCSLNHQPQCAQYEGALRRLLRS